MRESMAQLTPRFSADRTVREYTEQHYLPAASAFLERIANKGEKGKQMTDWLHSLDKNWNSLRFGEVKFATNKKEHTFNVQVYFNNLDPNIVQIEIYANGPDGEPPIVQKMTQGEKIENTGNGYNYYASVTAKQPASAYTARVIPYLPNVSVPLETSRILWQR
jgi:starch phosphorylase